MLEFLARRLLSSVPVVLAVLALCFLLVRNSPASPPAGQISIRSPSSVSEISASGAKTWNSKATARSVPISLEVEDRMRPSQPAW